jgi:DNA-binding SARP family transcriptional activator
MDAAPSPVRFRVLGPLEVGVGSRVLDLGGRRIRAVLALLLAGAGRVVSVAALVDGLWDGQAPADAEQTVRSYTSRLRKALLPAAGPDAGELLLTRPPGYLLRLDPDALDAARFERLAAAGRRALDAGRPADAAEQLAAALGLWRGEAYGEFGGTAALRDEGARLDRLRLAAVADRIDADLALGLGGELVAELEGLIGAHPRHERLWGQLMTTLYRAGRQADALEAFRRARRVLVEESGVEPSPELAEIHRRVLAQDPQLLGSRPAHPAAVEPRVGPAVRPAQLPSAVAAFTGREEQLAALDRSLAGALATAGPDGRPAAVAIAAVSGTAGVGKTSLAVHWAHQVADRFPDGQLYVNLRGFDPGGQAMVPAEAVRGFLDAMGVPAGRIPAGLDAQAALYRSTLAGKRILVVLDNARDAEQVRPLLPGTAGAMVVITSRSQLTGLVAANGARPIPLDLMPPAAARELLAARLGAARLGAEPEATDQIIAACARLPLALTIAAARAATNPAFPLTALAAELGQAGGRLDALAIGDPATDVHVVFSWSYQALTPPAARLFRLLGLHPGPDISVPAAASLAGHTPAELRGQLAELLGANLISEPVPGRYTFHDLLRAYAGELAHRTDTETDRHAAVGRLLDHYTHTAHAANQHLSPARDPIPVPLRPLLPGASPARLTGPGPALAWLTAEHSVLLAALGLAADSGFHTHTWQLAWALNTPLIRGGHGHDLAAAWQAALTAAERLGDPTARAYAHCYLARAYTLLGRYPDAHRELGPALQLYDETGDLVGQASAHHHLAVVWERQGRPGQALEHAQQALALYQAGGNRRGHAYALNAVAWHQAQLGDHAEALAHSRQALALHQQIGDRVGEAETWDTLGYAHHHLNHHAQAINCYQHALTLFRDLGDRSNEAATLTDLGDIHHAAGDPTAARTAWQQALTILTDLDHPDAADLHAKLHALDLPAITTA